MAQLSSSPPWIRFYQNIEALFKKDPKVKVLYDDEKKTIQFFVDDPAKASAIETLFPSVKIFDNDVSINISVISDDKYVFEGDMTVADMFEEAFSGNKIVEDCLYVEGIYPMGHNPSYILFTPEIVQFYTDNICDYAGLRSTLYEDIAREVFDDINGVYFCTSQIVKSDVTKIFFGSSCEWP